MADGGDAQIALVTAPAFVSSGLVYHGFSSRLGGVSAEPFASLNVGLSTGDAPEAVWENRRLLLSFLGFRPETPLVFVSQVHSDKVITVNQMPSRNALAGEADALLTALPGVALAIQTADCVPILLLDPVRRVVGAVHAGWRGTVARIAGKTVRRMIADFGSRPADVLAAIGPSIGPCCYEVGREVLAEVETAFPGGEPLYRTSGQGRGWLNLWAANERDLQETGLTKQNICLIRRCTACECETFFSYRASGGITGRMAAVIGLRE